MLKTVAAKGHVNACLRLAATHGLGEFVAQNNKAAARFYGLAAEKGSSNAQCHFVRLHEEGHGVVQSQTKSMELYRLAAHQGSAQAQHDLTDVYLAVRTRSEAIRWFQKATAQGRRGTALALQCLRVLAEACVTLGFEPN